MTLLRGEWTGRCDRCGAFSGKHTADCGFNFECSCPPFSRDPESDERCECPASNNPLRAAANRKALDTLPGTRGFVVSQRSRFGGDK